MNGKCQAFQSLMNSACGSGEFTLVQECEVSADRQNLQMHFIHMVTSPTTSWVSKEEGIHQSFNIRPENTGWKKILAFCVLMVKCSLLSLFSLTDCWAYLPEMWYFMDTTWLWLARLGDSYWWMTATAESASNRSLWFTALPFLNVSILLQQNVRASASVAQRWFMKDSES